MMVRRALFAGIGLLASGGVALLLVRALGPGGWSGAKLLLLACFAATAPWTAICAANGLIGFAILMCARDPVRAAFPIARAASGPLPPTAVALTIRDENLLAVLPPLRRLLDGLDRAGHSHRFALFVLSDTADPAAAVAEQDAVRGLSAMDPDPARIRYRRRSENDGFKAGNIMEFLDNHAEGFELMLTLDADSVMSAAAVLRLVRAMRAEPRLGIVQHLTVGLPATAAFPRLFQFGMRAGMRVWATGQAWWQGDEGPYWGHNAVVRIAPFRAHCRLDPLPDGRAILSHDQVEAARMRAAGWGVRVLPDEDGSREANPPTLPEFLRRERRWLAGNMQYFYLLAADGLRPMGRWQLVQAILLFAGAPFYVLLLATSAWLAATDVPGFPSGPVLTAMLAWFGALHAPKLLGYAEVLLSRGRRAPYGGAARVLAGAGAEIAFTLLLDPVTTVGKTLAMARLAVGKTVAWPAQNRADRRVSWREATRLLWPHTLIGVLAFAGFAHAGWAAVLWAIPLAGGLLVAVPLCVLTAEPRVGAWMRRRRLAAIPEERA
jgi:membrane glycosyltransferase